MLSANCIHRRSKVIVSNSTFSVRLGPEKSQLDSRSFFIYFFIYFFTIYLSNKLFMYSIKLNHFLLKNLLILTLQQVFLFVNSEITRNLNNIPISLFLFFPISLFPYFLVFFLFKPLLENLHSHLLFKPDSN